MTNDEKLILKEWLKEKLSSILQFEIEDSLAEVIINKKTDELETYLRNLLNFKDSQTRKFFDELMKRRRVLNCVPSIKKKDDIVDEKYRVKQKKDRIISDSMVNFDQKLKKFGRQSSDEGHPKTKNKSVQLNPKTGEVILLKGRYCCNCEARKHQLINNCLTCGRIVCEQEGSGPCYVCGTLVCTPEEQAAFNGDTIRASKLYEKLLTKEKPKGLEEALKQRDALLDFDRNTEKHTHVFDDDSDYFCSTNPWLTLQEREQIKKREEEFFNKKQESRRNKKFTLKLQDRKLVEEEITENMNNTYSNKLMKNDTESSEYKNNDFEKQSIDHLIDPYFRNFDLKFEKRLKANSSVKPDILTCHSRIMDIEFHQLTDEGYCISIHQPWASFLVHGIRIGEGRTWYTPYRGKLWIASSGAHVSRSDCEKYENTYRLLRGDIIFPADYPSGCLLGCVDLVDCLTQEQYLSEFPNGEIEDPYVFICENPQVSSVRYPIRGKPNIYKLDEKIHKAAKNSLKMTEKILSESEYKVKSLRP